MLELIKQLERANIDAQYLTSVNENRARHGLRSLTTTEIQERVRLAIELLTVGAYV